MRILLVALGLPLAEIAAFVVVGGWIGVLPVLGLVVLAAVVGVGLVRSLGEQTAARVRGAMAGRGNPLEVAGTAAFRMAAGMLLILPGFVTDAVAMLLLLPPVQRVLIARVAARMPRQRPVAGEVIEGEIVEMPPPGGQEPSGWTRH